MKSILILTIAFVLLIPSTALAQYMGNVGGEGETGSYTLEEALELQRKRIESAEANPASGSGTDSKCGSGTILDTKTNSCVLIPNVVKSEITCGTGTIEINGICQVDKDPEKKQTTSWFSWLFDWFKAPKMVLPHDCAKTYDEMRALEPSSPNMYGFMGKTFELMDHRCMITIESWAHESWYESSIWQTDWEYSSYVNQLYLGEVQCNDAECKKILDAIQQAKDELATKHK